jgi:hypothetical protein
MFFFSAKSGHEADAIARTHPASPEEDRPRIQIDFGAQLRFLQYLRPKLSFKTACNLKETVTLMCVSNCFTSRIHQSKVNVRPCRKSRRAARHERELRRVLSVTVETSSWRLLGTN